MAKLTTLLLAFLSITSTIALQVAPNSQCASVCIDDSTQDKSDPGTSNIVGSDVICRDGNYATPAGQKYKRCVECLQNSADKSQSESDLQWFLYNLRFSVGSCLFGLHNASDPLSSPCSIAASCGPLVGAIQDGMGSPTNDNRYSYCTAFGESFLGQRYWPCTRCLRLTEDQKYMSNFMLALKAGCDQKPAVGQIIGLDGTLFSPVQVNATTSATQPSATSVSGNSSAGLSTGAYAGIGVAGAVVLAIVISACIVGRKKHKAKQERERLSSGLDNRFGNGNITVPIHGAYGDPNPPKPTAYQSVGLVNVQSKSEKTGFGVQIHDHNAHEAFLPPLSHHRPVSMMSHHTIPSRGVVPSPYARYDPSRNSASPQPFQSPGGSFHPTNSPSHHSRSDSRQTHNSEHSANETSNLTRNIGPPVIGSGVARGSSRSRSDSVESLKGRPVRRNTRDLSLSRGDDRTSISGPIVSVDSRSDVEADEQRKQERERLYRMGFKSKHTYEKPVGSSKEQWPGNY